MQQSKAPSAEDFSAGMKSYNDAFVDPRPEKREAPLRWRIKNQKDHFFRR